MVNSINGIRGSSKANLDTTPSAENEDVGLGWDNLGDVENGNMPGADESGPTEAGLDKKNLGDLSTSQGETGESLKNAPDTVANIFIIASGERSSLQRVKKADGKTTLRVESEYFDIANDFARANKDRRNNFELDLAMSGLSMDLALIDATQGKCFEKIDGKRRFALLENYGILRSHLDGPDTDPEEKGLISEYLDQMSGEALTFLEGRYESEREKSDYEKKEEESAKFNNILNEAKEKLANAKTLFLWDSKAFDEAFSRMTELIEERSMDVDLLRGQLQKLTNAIEDLESSTRYLATQNIDCETIVVKGQDFLSEDDYETNRKQFYENEELMLAAFKKIHDLDDKIAQINRYISTVEETLISLRDFE